MQANFYEAGMAGACFGGRRARRSHATGGDRLARGLLPGSVKPGIQGGVSSGPAMEFSASATIPGSGAAGIPLETTT